MNQCLYCKDELNAGYDVVQGDDGYFCSMWCAERYLGFEESTEHNFDDCCKFCGEQLYDMEAIEHDDCLFCSTECADNYNNLTWVTMGE